MSFLTRTDILDINIGATVIPTKITRYKFIDDDTSNSTPPHIEIVAFAMDEYILRVILTDYNYYLLPTLLGYVGHKMLSINLELISDDLTKTLVREYAIVYLSHGNLKIVLD